jgi:transcriptional regulator with XRE-family HTH domain
MPAQELLTLWDFRRAKNLKQSDIADFLGTTPSYVSLVENGSSKFSDENIDRILLHWGPEGLVPAYARLLALANRLVLDGYLAANNFANETYIFYDYLPFDVVNNIKHARIGITQDIADKLVTHFPFVNKDWLLTGNGDMFKDVTVEERMANLEERLDRIEAKVDEILKLLSSAQNVHSKK